MVIILGIALVIAIGAAEAKASRLRRIDRLVADIEDNYIGKFDAQKTFWYIKVDEIRKTLEE